MRTQSKESNTQFDVTNQLLNTKEMAARIGVRPYTVQKWARAGIIPCYRPSVRTLLYDPVEVIASLKQLRY